MTDFVLKQMNEVMLDRTGAVCARLGNYAQFLKQPLKLGMFLPCGDMGNVLSDPGLIPSYELEQYRKAKERVLFSGFDIISIEDNCLYIHTDECSFCVLFKDESVDDYVNHGLTLTPTALKQIGL